MKMFRRISMLICAVSVMTLFSMTVLATAFSDIPYSVTATTFSEGSYYNASAQSTYHVSVDTQPEQGNGVARVAIYPTAIRNPWTDTGTAVAVQSFPGNMKVPAAEFDLPAGKTYYVYVTTYLDMTVSGTLHAVY